MEALQELKHTNNGMRDQLAAFDYEAPNNHFMRKVNTD